MLINPKRVASRDPPVLTLNEIHRFPLKSCLTDTIFAIETIVKTTTLSRPNALENPVPSMTTWLLKQKNILDEPAHVLVCSANVNLLLSGGVGADLLARYGNRMQEALLAQLRTRNPHCAQRGEIFQYAGPEIPNKLVLHAVAIDGWYESSPEVITDIVRRALKMAAEAGAGKIALTALATGFGHLTFADFARGIKPLLAESFPPINEIVICLLLDFQVADLSRHLPEIQTK
jgi:O-acetyl-ADP-ribose deacetylase (regulator of RNase III)